MSVPQRFGRQSWVFALECVLGSDYAPKHPLSRVKWQRTVKVLPARFPFFGSCPACSRSIHVTATRHAGTVTCRVVGR